MCPQTGLVVVGFKRAYIRAWSRLPVPTCETSLMRVECPMTNSVTHATLHVSGPEAVVSGATRLVDLAQIW